MMDLEQPLCHACGSGWAQLVLPSKQAQSHVQSADNYRAFSPSDSRKITLGYRMGKKKVYKEAKDSKMSRELAHIHGLCSTCFHPQLQTNYCVCSTWITIMLWSYVHGCIEQMQMDSETNVEPKARRAKTKSHCLCKDIQTCTHPNI